MIEQCAYQSATADLQNSAGVSTATPPGMMVPSIFKPSSGIILRQPDGRDRCNLSASCTHSLRSGNYCSVRASVEKDADSSPPHNSSCADGLLGKVIELMKKMERAVT